MCRKIWGKVVVVMLALLIIMPVCAMTGCSGSKEPDNKIQLRLIMSTQAIMHFILTLT